MTEWTLEAMKRTDGSRARCLLRLSDRPQNGQECRIEAVMGQRAWTRGAADYFAALVLIRQDLEADGWLLSCYGASRNVYASGMARDMGLGLKAYKMRLGEHVGRDDLVEIFRTGPDVEPATVDEQQAFWKEWLATCRS